MLADIASGEVDTADVVFLIAVIVAVVAAALAATTAPQNRFAAPLGWLAVALVAFGFLLL